VWEIYENGRVRRRLRGMPVEILKRYEKWKDIVRISGPRGLLVIRGLNDEPLARQWQGHRSSRLNQQYRVIYRVVRNEIFVEVVDVTAHDYRRK
jgi:plasmid maintenance system killer protein